MLEFVSNTNEGLPPIEMAAYACLLGKVASVVYVPKLTIHEVDEEGALVVDDVLLQQARLIGWVPTSDYGGWAEPAPGWSATLTAGTFTVRQPDGLYWYDGTLPVTPQWSQAAEASHQVFHFTTSQGDAHHIVEQIGTDRVFAIVTQYRSLDATAPSTP
ncbi:hypothetical protein [Streptomyces sp. NBC_01422]|uniref:hypothetical protein n=1 Tax=Streptomyces sp. NBC_01422 TaxID=2903859 RepID=UPI002E2ADE10|nr:hypothetical protein [Streptomyces sp. NBC_01422]